MFLMLSSFMGFDLLNPSKEANLGENHHKSFEDNAIQDLFEKAKERKEDFF